MLATLPEGTVTIDVDVDVVDVADVLLAVVLARVVGDACERTCRSVCAPLGTCLVCWDGGGENGGTGRLAALEDLSCGWGTGPGVFAPACALPDATGLGD